MSPDLTLPGPDIPVIDESRMNKEFGGCREILGELRDLFLEHAPQLYDPLHEAMVAGETQVVADTAHSLKGACATYGAERLTIICKQIESAVRTGDPETVRSYGDELKKEYDAVIEAVGQMAVN